MGRAKVTGKRKLTQRQREIEESKSAPSWSNARDGHIEPNNDKLGRTRAAKKMKLAHIPKELEESESAPRCSNARDEHIESDNNVRHKDNPKPSKNIAVQTVVNFENNGARTGGRSQAAEDNAMQTRENFTAMDKARAMKKKELTYKQKEIEESKTVHKVSNAMAKHVEPDNNVRNEDDPHASKTSASQTVKMGRTRAVKQKKLAHIHKEIEESESAPKWSNARDEHIESDNNVHEDNPQASKNIAIQTVVNFENNGAQTGGRSQAAEDNAMQTEGNFDSAMDKKMGKVATKKKELTHKQKDIEESKSALKVSNATAKHIEPDNNVRNGDAHASKNSASVTVKRGRGRAKKKEKLPHKQKRTDESKSTPKGSHKKNEHIEPCKDVLNEDNQHAFKYNAAQTEVNSENNSAQVEYVPQSFEDNVVQTEGGIVPVMEIEELIQDKDKNPIVKKRTRGPTKAERLYLDLASRIKVEFNAEGVPIGPGSVKLSSYLGPLVRKHVPVTLKNWRCVSNELKAVLWKSIQAEFKLDEEWQKRSIFHQMGCIWRSSKCRLVRNIIKAKTDEERFKLKPDNLESTEWSKFIESKTSLNFKTLSEKYKAIRSNQIPHTCGRKGMARLTEDLKEQSIDPSSISRVQVWIKSHTKKNGEPVSVNAANTIEKIKKIEKELESSSSKDVKENALLQVLGQDRPGRLIAMGRGKTLTNVAQDKQIAQFQSRISELEGMVHMLMKNQHGNESLREESISQMSKCDKISDKCDLLDWSGTDEIVAEGRVVSSDPNELVHKVPLGPNAMKILILVSRKSDVFLWRPTPSLTYIGDAEDRIVAWPASRVVSRTVQHYKEWDNGKTNSTDKKCKLYDWSGSEELVAEGRLCSSDPKQMVNDIPLGPSAMEVWVDDPKKRDAFLWRPTSGMTFVGDAVGRKVAWPKSNVVIDYFNPTVTATISPVTTKEHGASLWRPTSGMSSVGEAVSRKAAWPKSNVPVEKFNNVASPTPTVNATISPMPTNFMPRKKCKLIDLIGAGEIVAEGRVLSMDPNALVHFVPLGRNAVKVLVDFVKVPNAVLWRPSSELEYIEDAIGTAIAWPAANVIMESTSDN